jgi:GrpB-like predicted nucleotidyltransferase (UPF0157 family)
MIMADNVAQPAQLQPIPVVLVEYDPTWPLKAKNFADQLRHIGQNILEVHHIGSTSIPGLAAKPIIDLLPVVKSLKMLDQSRKQIEVLGFHWHGEYGIRDRRFCTMSNYAGIRIAHLHFFETDSLHITRHLAFRDYLRAHPKIAAEYEAEKHRARELHPNNSHDYSNEKAHWIKTVEARALSWLIKH